MKPFRAALIPITGSVVFIELKTLEDMQCSVGGFIEVIRFGTDDNAWAYVNEDGRDLQLAPNHAATRLLFARGTPAVPPGDTIRGTMIVGGPVVDGEQQSITLALERWINLNTREG